MTRRRIALLAAGGCAFAVIAAASDDAAPPASADLSRVLVTGSQVPRVDAETALPVQVIRREEIERSGALSVEELLGRVSANLATDNEATGIGNGDTPGLSSVNLRGLSTLVLLNGRRIANYAFSSQLGGDVDLHAIPLAAIERIEVLKDGASALYGSDAVSGVVNFILRKDYRGADVGFEGAAPEAGAGERTRQTFSFGAGDLAKDGFNAFAVIDHQAQHALAARDRAFSATSYRPDLGLDGTSPASFPANIPIGPRRDPNAQQFLNPAAPECTDITVFKNGACRYDFVRQIDALPRSANTSLLSRATLALPDSAEAYAELLWSRARFRHVISATPVDLVRAGAERPIIVPASSPFYPQGLGLSGDIVDPKYRTVPLGPRIDDIESEALRSLLGVRGSFAGWDVDSALMRSVNRVADRFANGYVDAKRLIDAFATGLINPFGDSGPDGDALLARTETRGLARAARGTMTSVDVRASRDLAQWRHGPVSLALGGEARREALDDHANPISEAAAGGSFRSPKDGARTVQAVFAELVLPLAHKLEAQLAARVDRYSDFGSHASPKLALRWQPARSLVLRASAGRGFRAPSLPELFTAQTSGLGEFIDTPDPKRCPVTMLESDCNDFFVHGLAGGNPALRPERSRQASAGLVFESPAGWSLGVDVWRIAVQDKIAAFDDDTILAGGDAFEKNIVRGPVDPAFPNLPGPITGLIAINENVGRLSTSGADLDLRWRFAPTEIGRFALQWTGSYTREWNLALDGVHETSIAGRSRLGFSVPRWKQSAALDWDRGPLRATLVNTWQGGYLDEEDPDANGNPRRVGPQSVWDAQLGYAARRDVDLAVGVKNLLDRDPPFAALGARFQQGYDPAIGDPRGRTWYARARLRWR